MIEYKLYLKTSPLGLKYLGRFNTRKDGKDLESYTGSGIRWRHHLKAHGFKAKDLKTEVLFVTSNLEEFIEKANYYSKLYNVVESKEFANLIEENGTNGGLVGRVNGMFGKRNLGVSKRMKGLTGYNNPTSKEVFQYDLQNNFIQKFGSTREASRSLKIDQGNISLCCRGKLKTAGGYTWKYS
jgi:hypothetical protein